MTKEPTEKQVEEGYTLILAVLAWRRSFLEMNMAALKEQGLEESDAYHMFYKKWKALVQLSKDIF